MTKLTTKGKTTLGFKTQVTLLCLSRNLQKNIHPVYFSQEISNNIMICLVKGKSFESMKCVRKLIILLINNK